MEISESFHENRIQIPTLKFSVLRLQQKINLTPDNQTFLFIFSVDTEVECYEKVFTYVKFHAESLARSYNRSYTPLPLRCWNHLAQNLKPKVFHSFLEFYK